MTPRCAVCGHSRDHHRVSYTGTPKERRYCQYCLGRYPNDDHPFDAAVPLSRVRALRTDYPRAHTYASENADTHLAWEDGWKAACGAIIAEYEPKDDAK